MTDVWSFVWSLAVHDVIATTVRQCQRVIIIMSADDDELSVVGNNKEELLRNQSQLHYEQSISLYDALLLNDPKVILVEIGEQRLVTNGFENHTRVK